MKTLQEYGLHHAGFVVKDLEKTIKRFEEVYGIRLVLRRKKKM